MGRGWAERQGGRGKADKAGEMDRSARRPSSLRVARFGSTPFLRGEAQFQLSELGELGPV